MARAVEKTKLHIIEGEEEEEEGEAAGNTRQTLNAISILITSTPIKNAHLKRNISAIM